MACKQSATKSEYNNKERIKKKKKKLWGGGAAAAAAAVFEADSHAEENATADWEAAPD